tara:strand:+ start:331 stop:702 length:372 start_codon:yes stop_codon:yes gene_type:complete
MPTTYTLTLTFSAPLNVSCQVGDTAYYVNTTASGGFTVNSNNVEEIGTITAITNPTSSAPTITCSTTLPGSLNGSSYFVLFSKNNKANLSSVLGYYADIEFKNDSKKEAELFTVGMDMFESSK